MKRPASLPGIRHLKTARAACLAVLMLILLTASVNAESLAFGRELSSQYASYGEWITLRYTVCNTTSQDASAVTVSDPLVGEVGYIDQLVPGESRVFTARIRVTADCLSSPALSCKFGNEEMALSAEQAQIILETAHLDAVLGEETDGDTHTLVLTVTNEGNAPVYGIKAFDQVLGDMGAALAVLEAGESARFERILRGSEEHMCRVTASSAAGQALEADSNTLTASAAPVGDDHAVTLNARLEGNAVLITVTNGTSQIIQGAVLHEASSDEARTLHFLAAGEAADVLWQPDMASEGTLCFELTLPDGETITAEPLDWTAPDDTPDSDTANPDIPDGLSFRLADNPQTYRDMMIGATSVLAGLLGAAWLSSTLRRCRERRRRIKKRQELRKKQRLNQRSTSQKSEEKNT